MPCKFQILLFCLYTMLLGTTYIHAETVTSSAQNQDEILMQQWAPDESQIAIVFQNLHHVFAYRDQLNKLLEKLPFPPAQLLRKHLERVDVSTHDFDGLDLQRGIGFFFNVKNKQFRFVVAVNDQERLLKSLKQHIPANAQQQQTVVLATDHLRLGTTEFQCQVKAQWWVCDTGMINASKVPTWAEDLSNKHNFWAYINLEDSSFLPRRLKRNLQGVLNVVHGAKLQVANDQDQAIVQLDVLANKHPFVSLLNTPRNTKLLNTMTQLTPVALKVDLPLREFFQTFGPMVEKQVPPQAQSIFQTLKKGADGSLSLAFVKDFTRPILSIGFIDAQKAKDLLATLSSLGLISITENKPVKQFIFSLPNRVSLSAYYVITHHGLHIALTPGDLQRISQPTQNKYATLDTPPEFTKSHFGIYVNKNFIELLDRVLSIASLVDVSKAKPIPFDLQSLFTQLQQNFLKNALLFLDASLALKLDPQGAHLQLHIRKLPSNLIADESKTTPKKTMTKVSNTSTSTAPRMPAMKLTVDQLGLDTSIFDATTFDAKSSPVMVEVKADDQVILRTKAKGYKSTLNWTTVSQHFALSTQALSVYIYTEKNGKKVKLSAIRVRPKLNQITSSVTKKYKGKGIKVIHLKLIPVKPYKASYAAQRNMKSSLTFTPTIESNSAAAQLYRQYIDLKLKDLELEALEVLIQLITQYPTNIYAVKARRILF